MMRKIIEAEQIINENHRQRLRHFPMETIIITLTGRCLLMPIISRRLIIQTPNTTLQQADIVNEVKNGYIIKVEEILSLPQGCQNIPAMSLIGG